MSDSALHRKNATVAAGIPTKGAIHSRELAHKAPEMMKMEKFHPSPELAGDFSQSSESNEKPVISKDHHYVSICSM